MGRVVYGIKIKGDGMKIIIAKDGKKKISLTKSEWKSMGKKAGWVKMAETPSTAQQIGTTFQGYAGGFQEAGEAKVQEYAQRIMKGEQKEKVLEGQGPTMIKSVEAALAQLQQGQQATPASSQQPQGQYSLSKSEQWANSTQDPNIMDYVGKVNQSIQTQGTQKWAAILNIIMKAMSGDQSALQQLRQKSGGQAIPIQR